MSRQIAYHAAVSFVLKGIGGFSGFAFAALVSRSLGAYEAGFYFFAFAVVNVLSVISRFGLDRTVLRFLSVDFFNERFNAIKGILIFYNFNCNVFFMFCWIDFVDFP